MCPKFSVDLEFKLPELSHSSGTGFDFRSFRMPESRLVEALFLAFENENKYFSSVIKGVRLFIFQ